VFFSTFENGFPDTQFEFMHQVNHQHLERIETQRPKLFNKSILLFSLSAPSHCDVEKSHTTVGTRDSPLRSRST
jgi:hypothetical protein